MSRWLIMVMLLGAIVQPAPGAEDGFIGSKPGEEHTISGLKLCWCPPGKFIMGSPTSEQERRADEAQVEVTLTRGFWMAKFETTQADWKRAMGTLPAPATEQLLAQDDLPVGNVNFAEAEEFCRHLTDIAHASHDLPAECEFRLPTEAQWEYACAPGH